MNVPRQDRPVGAIPGFHCRELDGLTLKEFTILLMAHAHRSADRNAPPATIAAESITDAEAIMAEIGADQA